MKFIAVTTKKLYVVDGEHDVERFIETFTENLNSHHAWREGSAVGNSKRLVAVEILDDIEDYDSVNHKPENEDDDYQVEIAKYKIRNHM